MGGIFKAVIAADVELKFKNTTTEKQLTNEHVNINYSIKINIKENSFISPSFVLGTMANSLLISTNYIVKFVALNFLPIPKP